MGADKLQLSSAAKTQIGAEKALTGHNQHETHSNSIHNVVAIRHGTVNNVPSSPPRRPLSLNCRQIPLVDLYVDRPGKITKQRLDTWFFPERTRALAVAILGSEAGI